MRNLNQKQEAWVRNNTPIGKVLSTGEFSSKIIGHDLGYVLVEHTHTEECSEDNYNMGLINHDELLSGNPKVSIHVVKLSYNNPVWKSYFPELLNIKSK
jgi:hypothetical protein